MSSALISVAITTRNRRDELRRALQSCVSQVGVSFEILVYDDQSDDGTDVMVRTEFPEVRLIRHELRAGLIVRRNESFRDARGEYVLSLDDDAYFTSRDTLSQVCELFDREPRTAAWGLQYYEPANAASMPTTPTGTLMKSYIGCAHAVRRRVAEQLGGYPALLVHQGEERDLCIRLLDGGWEIRFAQTPPIIHLCSPHRENARIMYYGYRNLVLFNWMRVPARYLIPRMCLDIIQLLKHRFSVRRLPIKLWCISAGFVNIVRYWRERQPVSLTAYRTFRNLKGHGPSANPEPVTPPPVTAQASSPRET